MGEEGDRIRKQLCPVSNCVLSDDRRLVAQSAAVIFHAIDFDANDLPPERDSEQYYVFFTLESPQHSTGPDLPDFFNLTFTYRFDSDCIADNYLQYFRPRTLRTEADLAAIWERKTNDRAAVFLTNCGGSSRRMEYIQELRRHYPVDVYGGCGNLSCPRETTEECDDLVSTYKFYLAFENR